MTTSWGAGTQVGPYELISAIGAGGMGEVWKARDTRLDRIVAIKRLYSHQTTRFEQEARAVAALNHPHICQIHDVGPDYLVFEYVDGKPLHCPMPSDDALRLAIQVAGALEEAHRRGIIHRDLKPANIMVTTGGSAKLLDFGLAKLTSDAQGDVTKNTMEGTLLGTLPYMSPEQAEGRTLDVRSDVFSFGAVLYEMLSGTRAFPGNSAAQVLSAVLRDEPRPLDVAPKFERVVRRCLTKEPAQRFQTMAELKAALEQVSAKPLDEQPSIAVLPFANLSADKENEYFSDGLAEEIINMLVKLPGLKVTARTSAFAFRGREQDIRKTAETLNVRSVLEGSVRRSGNRIRVTAQLINAEDGYHLWSERYDRELADVFAIQDEIAEAIAAALQMQLSPQTVPRRRYTPSVPAYEAFLKGMHYWAKLTPDSWKRSKECFEQAIAWDPGFAAAHSFLGGCFITLAYAGLLPAREAFPAARSAIQQALDIDPSLPEAHAFRAALAVGQFDWNDAESHFRLALAQNPVSPYVRTMYGYTYLLPVGRHGEAIEQLQHVLREDPLNLPPRLYLAICLDAAGRDPIPELQKILEIDSTFGRAYTCLGLVHAGQGMFDAALAFAEKAYHLMPWNPTACGLLAAMLVRRGDTTRAKNALGNTPSDLALAWFHLVDAEIEQAVDWIERAIEERDPAVFTMLSGTAGRMLRSSPRWRVLARMMNLPEGL
jgi:serine/threonine protein kinase/tetratricopeptide (TPR) repeat protein